MLKFRMSDERVPCVYDLYFIEGNPPILRLRLHKDFVEANKDKAPLELFIRSFQEKHDLGEFLPFGSGYFGFDKVIKQGETVGEFIEYNIEIPVFMKETPEPCKHCKGTGWDKYFGRPCSWCEGSKHEIFYDWRLLNAVSASLHILNIFTELFEKDTSAKNSQLLSFQIICGKGMDGYPISGTYGIDFCNWLMSLPAPHYFDEAIKAMQSVHYHITRRKSGYSWDFQAYIEKNAWLIISCPGDACGIFPEGHSWKPGEGKEYSCHNMDNPWQQILLLVALAVLSDMARKYMEEISK